MQVSICTDLISHSSVSTNEICYGRLNIRILEHVPQFKSAFGHDVGNLQQHFRSFSMEHRTHDELRYPENRRSTHGASDGFREREIRRRIGRDGIQNSVHVIICNRVSNQLHHVVLMYPWKRLITGSNDAAEAKAEGKFDIGEKSVALS